MSTPIESPPGGWGYAKGKPRRPVTWWRDVSTWRDRLRGERQRRGLVVTEATPGVVHVSTEALNELLALAGFKREAAE